MPTTTRRRGPALRAAYGVLAPLVLLSACRSDQDDAPDPGPAAEERAAEARALVDALAARLGTDPEPSIDSVTAGTPGDDDSGLMLTCSVFVTTETDLAQELPELAREHEADGWQSRLDSETQVRLVKDPFTMGLTYRPAEGRTNVQGSGGCVRRGACRPTARPAPADDTSSAGRATARTAGRGCPAPACPALTS